MPDIPALLNHIAGIVPHKSRFARAKKAGDQIDLYHSCSPPVGGKLLVPVIISHFYSVCFIKPKFKKKSRPHRSLFLCRRFFLEKKKKEKEEWMKKVCVVPLSIWQCPNGVRVPVPWHRSFGNNYRIPDRCEQFVIKNSTFCKKRRAIFHISKAVAVILPVRGVNLPRNTL